MLDFKGRASRRKFWFVAGPVLIWNVVLVWLLGIVAPDGIRSLLTAVFVLVFLMILPDAFGLAALVRRLHDLGRSGYWIFAVALPIRILSALRLRVDEGWEQTAMLVLAMAITMASLLFVGLRKGAVGDNSFGPDPLRPALPSA